MLPKCVQSTVKHGGGGPKAWECILYNEVCEVHRVAEFINAKHC